MTIIRAFLAISFVLAILGYALHIAHERNNDRWCVRDGGPGAFYANGSCWMPMRRIDVNFFHISVNAPKRT